MITNKDITLLKLYREGNLNDEEIQYVYSLFSGYENNKEFQRRIKYEFDDYLKTATGEEQNLTYLLDRIHHIIRIEESRKKKTILKEFFRWYSVIAAVLLIPLLIAGAIWFTENKTEDKVIAGSFTNMKLYAPLGSRINFTLPDGTVGWLNSGSSLEYNTPFENNRNVNVLGEAWFEVAKNAEQPFEIKTGNSKLKVLGTKFNVSAYPEEKYVEVVLEEGKVKFSNPVLPAEVEMKPNERLYLSDGSLNVIQSIDASKYTAWKEGKIIFRGDPMSEVARRIERWYNVDVELVDTELESFVIRGIFQDDSLEEVLHFLSMTSPIKYQIIERDIFDMDSVQKKKILIFLEKEIN